jgi:hypothetical protein
VHQKLVNAILKGDEQAFQREIKEGPKKKKLSTWNFKELQRNIYLDHVPEQKKRIELISKLEIPITESISQKEFIQFCEEANRINNLRIKLLLERDSNYAFRYSSDLNVHISPLTASIQGDNADALKMLLANNASTVAVRRRMMNNDFFDYTKVIIDHPHQEFLNNKKSSEIFDNMFHEYHYRQIGVLECITKVEQSFREGDMRRIIDYYYELIRSKPFLGTSVCNREWRSSFETQSGMPQIDENGNILTFEVYLNRSMNKYLSPEQIAIIEENIAEKIIQREFGD